MADIVLPSGYQQWSTVSSRGRKQKRREEGRSVKKRIEVDALQYVRQLAKVEKKRKVELVFYATDQDGNWYDRLTHDMISWMSAIKGDSNRFMHVEMVFENGLSLGVDDVDPVHLDDKKFGRDGCKHITMYVPESAYNAIYKSAQDFEKRGTEFNFAGEHVNFLCFIPDALKIDRKGKRVFCSELLTRVLQDGGFLTHVEAHLVSPNRLHKLIRESGIHQLNGPTNSTMSEKFVAREIDVPEELIAPSQFKGM